MEETMFLTNEQNKARARRLIYKLLERELVPASLGKVQYRSTALLTEEDISIGDIAQYTDMKVVDECNHEYPSVTTTIGMVTGIRSRAWGALYIPKTLSTEERIARLEKDLLAEKAHNAHLEMRIAAITPPDAQKVYDVDSTFT